MIFDPRLKDNSPESVILDILAKKGKLTSKEIFEFFQKKHAKKITLQGFYKVIKKLLSSRILIKEGSIISFDSYWISKVAEFSDSIKKAYSQASANSADILIDEGESRTLEFENVMSMDNVWSHGLNMVRWFYANNDHYDKNAYSRNYFSVFQIARPESESATLQYFDASKMQWYMASGSNTFLNSLPSKLIEDENYHQFIFDFESYHQEHAEENIEKNYWVTTIGDFIFEAKFPKYIFEMIEQIYQNTNSISEFNAEKISKLFLEPGKTTLTISRDKKRSEQIRKYVLELYYNKGKITETILHKKVGAKAKPQLPQKATEEDIYY